MGWWMIIPFIAGFLMAVMDSVENENISKTVFNKLNQKWWSKRESWKHVKFIPFTKYRLDAWHLAKSLLILCVGLTSVFFSSITPWWYIDVIIIASIITVSFVLFYDYLLKDDWW
jgi:hypothetical protein